MKPRNAVILVIPHRQNKVKLDQKYALQINPKGER